MKPETCTMPVLNRYVRRLLRSTDKQYQSWLKAEAAAIRSLEGK